MIVGQLRSFSIVRSFEEFVTKPWSRTDPDHWSYDAFVCTEKPTELAKGSKTQLRIAAEWVFDIDFSSIDSFQVDDRANPSLKSKAPLDGKGYDPGGGGYMQHVRIHECGLRVLSYASKNKISYDWFVRLRPDHILTDELSHPIWFACSRCVYMEPQKMRGVLDWIS